MNTRRLFATVAATASLATLAACSSGPATVLTDTDQSRLTAYAGEAEVVAVAMHADWCGACQQLGPKMQQAATDLDDPRLTLVKADLTDRDSPTGERTLDEIGLSSLFESNGGATGVVYLIDAETGAMLGEITNGNSAASIREKLSDAIATAS
ncbi:MAG: thioredoxin domain-containing protein [Planctomycetota bacterium]